MTKRLSEEIEVLLEQLPLKLEGNERTITIGEFIGLSSRRGFGIVLLLLSLPAAIPTPAVGIATPLGLLIVLLGLQLLAGRSFPWLPNRICRKQIPPGFIMFLRQKGLPFLKRAEKWSGQRMGFVTQKTFRIAVGLIVGLMGAIMAIPLPLTNTLPALVVFILGLGLVSDDGLFILGGLAAGGISLAIYIAVAAFAAGMVL